MILSDKTIMEALDSGQINIDPTPKAEQIQPASLDIRLGAEVYDVTTDTLYDDCDEHTFESGHQYLGYTVEDVTLPNDLTAFLTGRSTLGRQFVTIHQTAGLIDPGFTGQVELEIINQNNEDKTFKVGDRVGQLWFIRCDQPSYGYDGQYQNQQGIETSGEI